MKRVVSFEELVKERRTAGYDKHSVRVKGSRVDEALFVDTSWRALQQLADSTIYLDFEIVKASSHGLRAEVRKLRAWRKQLVQIATEILEYRERVNKKVPELVQEDTVEVRADR